MNSKRNDTRQENIKNRPEIHFMHGHCHHGNSFENEKVLSWGCIVRYVPLVAVETMKNCFFDS